MAVEFGAERLDQVANLVVDRAPAAEVVVVFGDFEESLPGHVSTFGDVLKERHHVVGLLGTAEADDEDCVVTRRVGRPDRFHRDTLPQAVNRIPLHPFL